MREWILLHYKVPREPSASRVYVWRKLKRIGAVLLHDAIWVLPSNPRTMEQFQWLAAEIGELEGEAMLWESRLIQPGQEEKLVQQFMTQVEKDYLQILAELESGSQGETELDLTGLSKRYQQTMQQDYFHSDLGQQVREALLAASTSENQLKEVSRVEPGNELD